MQSLYDSPLTCSTSFILRQTMTYGRVYHTNRGSRSLLKVSGGGGIDSLNESCRRLPLQFHQGNLGSIAFSISRSSVRTTSIWTNVGADSADSAEHGQAFARTGVLSVALLSRLNSLSALSYSCCQQNDLSDLSVTPLRLLTRLFNRSVDLAGFHLSAMARLKQLSNSSLACNADSLLSIRPSSLIQEEIGPSILFKLRSADGRQ